MGEAMTETPDKPNYREERIERLLKELEYELVRGIIEGEIAEEMHWRYIVGVSRKIPDGAVLCTFDTRPVTRYDICLVDMQPRLRVVK